MASDGVDRAWWKEAVVYQIYPRSFNDSDGDGIGDLPGILERVDHVDALGADVVWLCPVYDSPQADNGYDIRDYRAIDDDYGDMADWERLLAELHDRDIGLVMDLVVNHTSDEHEWFRRSRRGDPEYADYYHWREGDPDEPPNNWESFFGGPAWSYDDEREAWYLHLFDEKQPDLNWRNPAVREDVTEMMRWWLEKGIDGFRMDVVNLLSKPEGLPDGDPEAGDPDLPTGAEHFVDGPRIHEYLSTFGDLFAEYDAMSVGEMVALDVDAANEYLGPDGDGVNMAFHFDHVSVDHGDEPWSVGDWSLTDLKDIFERWQTGLKPTAWDALYWENHDQPRSVSRFGDDGTYRYESATMLATFLMTHRGTPYVYQGQEIGMTNADFRTLAECRDVATVNRVELAIERGDIDGYEDVRDVVNHRSRDHARTPMQWSADRAAGFTDGEPWIKVNENYDRVNVAAQRDADDSVLAFYRDLVAHRADSDVLIYGDFELHRPDDETVYAFSRTLGDARALVVLNWTDERTAVDLGDLADGVAAAPVANYDDPATDLGDLRLRPYEAVVYDAA